jgi:hypothetical protein
MDEDKTTPLVPLWINNPPRWILWWTILIGIACLQVVLIFSGRWTMRHTISFPIFVAAAIVLHPLMKQKLPIFRLDIIRSWRTYVGVALIVVVNLIEW